MSNFAFGTYRISDYNRLHIEALKEAIRMRIPMIDTSSNYMDGAAERAIALACKEFDPHYLEAIEIVSKVGYIQGSNLELHKKTPFEEVVEYSESCYHCISPSFIADQLTRTLERLERSYLDCYLLHNPEYYLYDAIEKGVEEDIRLDEMYRRIYEAFVALEREVAAKRIGSYGISSNSFSLERSDPAFLPYEDLITLAQNAAQKAGNATHGFTTVQLPINLLEKEGLKCARWAKRNGLRVLANRPLNAQKEHLMYRLADYDPSDAYYTYLNELLEVCDTPLLKPLFTLIEQLDENKHKFGWIGDYESFLIAQILPSIKNMLQKLEDETIEPLLGMIDMFLQEYKQTVAHECANRTRTMLKEELANCFDTLQVCALKFLLEKEEIDFVLVGMRKPSYVHQVLSLQD
ncbi:MAG: aldo/keto reductase [Thiovulaceae bacterium]|nr:aldo/keto reductase [Sulfurimonadaceae bacterium]